VIEFNCSELSTVTLWPVRNHVVVRGSVFDQKQRATAVSDRTPNERRKIRKTSEATWGGSLHGEYRGEEGQSACLCGPPKAQPLALLPSDSDVIQFVVVISIGATYCFGFNGSPFYETKLFYNILF